MSKLLIQPTRLVDVTTPFRLSLGDLWAYKQCPAQYFHRQEMRKTKAVYAPAKTETEFTGQIFHAAISASVESRKPIIQKGLTEARAIVPDSVETIEERCLQMLKWGDSVLQRERLRFHWHQRRIEESTGIELITIFDALRVGDVPTVVEFKTRNATKISGRDNFQTIVSCWLLADEDTKIVKRKILYFGSGKIIEEQFSRAQLDNFMAQHVRPDMRRLQNALKSNENLAQQRSIGKKCDFCRHFAQCQGTTVEN
jgi:CRISPR/Cas system-associated exonuclease Cas4 (RecB family)